MASPQVVPAATVTTDAKPHGQQQSARDLEVERAVMGQRCRPQRFGEVQRCSPLCFLRTAAQCCCCSWASLTDQLVRKCKDSLGINTTMQKLSFFVPVQTIKKSFFATRTAVQASCEKHSTEWRLPRWCPQRRSPLMPSGTDSSNLHVI